MADTIAVKFTRAVLLGIGLLVAVSGCASSHSNATSYVDAIQTQSAGDPRTKLDTTAATCSEIVVAMREAARTWLKVTAPPEIAELHVQLGNQLATTADRFAEARDICRTDDAVLAAAGVYNNKWAEWCSAFQQQFHVDSSKCPGSNTGP